MFKFPGTDRQRWIWMLGACGLIVAGAAAALGGMGRAWWCKCGSPLPWSWDVASMHNSQHALDPYTLTHILHGLLLYALLRLVLGSRARPQARFVLALAIEAGWEVLENTDAVIETYRESTISLDYYGDSIANSIADMLTCIAGYLAAMRLPVRGTIVAFLGVELVLLVWIRDSLLLNILMLLFPIEAIKNWQLGG